MISFQPTEDQTLVIETIRRYVSERVVKTRHDNGRNRTIAAEPGQEGWGLGLLAGWVPEAQGGLGEEHSWLVSALYAEELAAGDVAWPCTC